MNIRINGKDETVEGVSNIASIVSGKGLQCDRIVIEHNRKIVPREEWAGTSVRENDTIEIVSFVGGG